MNFEDNLIKFYLIIAVIGLMVFFGFKSQKIEIPADKNLGAAWTAAVEEKKPLVLFFYVDWCGACQSIQPYMDQLKTEYESQYTFMRINCDDPENKELVRTFRVHSYPTIYLANPQKNKYARLKIYLDASGIVTTDFDKFLEE